MHAPAPTPDKGPTPVVSARRTLCLSGEQETLAIPLYATALDYRSKRSILHDQTADELVRSIDFDFERLRTPGNTRVPAARARQFHEWAREMLTVHLASLVRNPGCGLNTRVSRIPSPASLLGVALDDRLQLSYAAEAFAKRRVVG